MTTFTKQAKTPEQLIEILKLRGLTLADTTRAKRYIQSIGYYRLSAYFTPFQSSKDTFKRSVTFDDILTLYIFDRKLRNHVNTPYTNLAMIHAVLCSFTRNPSWSNGLYTLLQACPVDIHWHMKFPENWERIPFWRIS